MDIKLGTSTLTKRGADKGQANFDAKLKQDALKTSAKLGFCIVGGFAQGSKFSYKKADAPDQPTAETVDDALKPIFMLDDKL